MIPCGMTSYGCAAQRIVSRPGTPFAGNPPQWFGDCQAWPSGPCASGTASPSVDVPFHGEQLDWAQVQSQASIRWLLLAKLAACKYAALCSGGPPRPANEAPWCVAGIGPASEGEAIAV